uniref:Transposase (Putative), gypsy type n=1 Tax=Tanacetum cinerariifolium TaxID=118510 RepID=A0A6L2LZ67_TANCI|nr:hypothetical protein [Tanacetum cinerariifolium]GEV08657.1 hypothetical protein [Tanacetum cinerariifolium]
MGRDVVQLETAVTTISQEYLLEFTSEYGISEALHSELPGPEERIVDFPEGKTQPEALLYLVGLSRTYYLGDEVYPTFFHDDDRGGYFLIHTPNPTKVKIGTRSRAAHEVSLMTVTVSRVIEMEDPTAATDSSGVPSTIERSPLDFANENPLQQSTRPEEQGQEAVAPKVPPPKNMMTKGVTPEVGQAKGIAATGPHVVKERHKRGNDGVDTNAPPKVLRRDHADSRPTESTRRGKSLAAIELGMGSTHPVPASQGALVDVSDPDPLSFADPQSRPISSIGAAAAGDPESENTSFTSMDLVDHIAPPGYFSELCHLHNDEFLKQYNVNLARQVAMGSQLRLRSLSEQQPSVAAGVHSLSAGYERRKLKASFEEFKQYEGNRVEQRCTEMDARLDARRIDFNEELYPHMLTAIAGRMWGLPVTEGLKHGVEHVKANLSLEAIEAYDLEAEAKYITALYALKDLKYPIVDQLESLKDAPMDVIMASLNLESDTRDDAPQWIRELRPSSSQLTIPVYPEARDPTDPWACKEEILLADTIAANVSHAEKKKKFLVVCCTHRVSSAHHARSDGVPVSVPTVAPQGLAILLADAATQTEISEDGASLRLLRSSSLPIKHN